MTLSSSFNADAGDITAVLRFSRPADLQAIMDYYKGNLHQHVHIRDPKWIQDHVDKGQFLILQKPDGAIIASSATYDYVVPGDQPGKPSYYEVGSTNFSPEGQGYDLYPLFIASQCVQAYLEYPPQKMMIANVYDSSPVGRNLLTKIVGWKIIQPGADILARFKSSKSPANTNNGPMTWYGSDAACLPHQSRLVMNYLKQRVFTNKKTGKKLHIDFRQFPLANANLSRMAAMAALPQGGVPRIGQP